MYIAKPTRTIPKKLHISNTLNWTSRPKDRHIPNPMRVPIFRPKSLWSATAIESMVEVVTPITARSNKKFNILLNSYLLNKNTRVKYIANSTEAHSKAYPFSFTSALCQCCISVIIPERRIQADQIPQVIPDKEE